MPFPSPGDLSGSGIKPESLALAGRFFTTEPPEKPCKCLDIKSFPWKPVCRPVAASEAGLRAAPRGGPGFGMRAFGSHCSRSWDCTQPASVEHPQDCTEHPQEAALGPEHLGQTGEDWTKLWERPRSEAEGGVRGLPRSNVMEVGGHTDLEFGKPTI